MKDILLKRPSENQTEDLVNAMVESMRYSDNLVVYPSFDNVVKGEVPPEIFYNAYAGLGNDSERTAIHQYVTMQALHEDISTAMLGIAITEMKHMDRLGDLIVSLGGTLDQKWNNDMIKYGDTPEEALQLAIDGEEATINSYQKLVAELALFKNPTADICIQFINKLIADENIHIGVFKDLLDKVKKSGEKA